MHESFLVLRSFITFDMLRKCTFFFKGHEPTLLIANSQGVRISGKVNMRVRERVREYTKRSNKISEPLSFLHDITFQDLVTICRHG